MHVCPHGGAITLSAHFLRVVEPENMIVAYIQMTQQNAL